MLFLSSTSPADQEHRWTSEDEALQAKSVVRKLPAAEPRTGWAVYRVTLNVWRAKNLPSTKHSEFRLVLPNNSVWWNRETNVQDRVDFQIDSQGRLVWSLGETFRDGSFTLLFTAPKNSDVVVQFDDPQVETSPLILSKS